MAQFVTGKELETAVYDIIWDAKKTLLIVSPYIRLDEYFKKLFLHHLNSPELHIVIVFGKNVNSIDKSLSIGEFPEELEIGSNNLPRPGREEKEISAVGYCIRTGIKIKFNPKIPFSPQAYAKWSIYKNPNYPEKYCHKTGKPSNGKTSMLHPIFSS